MLCFYKKETTCKSIYYMYFCVSNFHQIFMNDNDNDNDKISIDTDTLLDTFQVNS